MRIHLPFTACLGLWLAMTSCGPQTKTKDTRASSGQQAPEVSATNPEGTTNPDGYQPLSTDSSIKLTIDGKPEQESAPGKFTLSISGKKVRGFVYRDYILGDDSFKDCELPQRISPTSIDEKLEIEVTEAGYVNLCIWGFNESGDVQETPDVVKWTVKEEGSQPDIKALMQATSLSQTGLYSNIEEFKVAEVNLLSRPNFPLWSDGEEKKRWLHLPPGKKIDTSDGNNWVFPVGTIAWKEFKFDGKRLETRMFVKKSEGKGLNHWYRVAFKWNEDQTEATVADPSGEKDVLGTNHDIPSMDNCVSCHRGASDGLLGHDAIQLSEELSTKEGRLTIAELVKKDALTKDPGPVTIPGNEAEKDVLGYLHGNCSSCHNDNGAASHKPLRLKVSVGLTNLNQTLLFSTAISKNQYIEIGSPDGSRLFQRVSVRGSQQMPPLGTEVVDSDFTAKLRDFITNLGP